VNVIIVSEVLVVALRFFSVKRCVERGGGCLYGHHLAGPLFATAMLM
jgi:hypothetical protein